MLAWAHNNHVADDRGKMGTFLRKAFGKDMAVFGFAFNEGSFDAFERGKGIHPFAVPAAPAGTFDAIVASANMPLAVIDFRSLPPGSALAQWLREPRVTRDIGSVYADADADKYLVKHPIFDRYDALIFTEKTTPVTPTPEARIVANPDIFPA